MGAGWGFIDPARTLRKTDMPMPEQMGAMGDEDTMSAPPAESPSEPTEDTEQPHIFASMKSLPPGVKPVKGMSFRAEVEDIDPESGDTELCLYPLHEGENKSEGYEAAFDKAMPPENEKGY